MLFGKYLVLDKFKERDTILVNPVRELRSFTPLERDLLTGRAVCGDGGFL